MTRTTAAALALAGLASLGAACDSAPPPCTQLSPPSQVEVEAARGGVEVEREYQGAECVVVGDRWVDERDLEEQE